MRALIFAGLKVVELAAIVGVFHLCVLYCRFVGWATDNPIEGPYFIEGVVGIAIVIFTGVGLVIIYFSLCELVKANLGWSCKLAAKLRRKRSK
jgi:hypothetical protein